MTSSSPTRNEKTKNPDYAKSVFGIFAFQEPDMEIKEWTTAEESSFRQIMTVSDSGRLPAIRLYRRCNSNLAKALQIAKDCYGLSDSQKTAYEQTKAARIAGLVKARTARRLNGSIQQRNPRTVSVSATAGNLLG